MMGGAWFRELFGHEDSVKPDDLITVATEALRQQLGITQKPTRVLSNIHKVSAGGIILILILITPSIYTAPICRPF